MKTKLSVLMTCAAFVALPTGYALNNPSFEEGSTNVLDLPGWTISLDSSVYSRALRMQAFGGTGGWRPVAGSWFGAIEIQGYSFDPAQNITMSQALDLNTGDTVSGWAALSVNDNARIEARVRMIDSVGGTVSVWTNAFDCQWQSWTWQAPAAGQYTLELSGVVISDPRLAAGLAMFDAIQVVPEPTTGALLILGALGVCALRRRR